MTENIYREDPIKTDAITYSELFFFSFQGEGRHTGHNTLWIRLFACNLECKGFAQKDPTDPSTYDLPYLNFDPSTVSKMEDLPVWEKGCDSSYSWAAKFKHLAHKSTAEEIASKLTAMLRSDTNPGGSFYNEFACNDTHLCFTGGEPLLPKNQRAAMAILAALYEHKNAPWNVTFETNGTQQLLPEFEQAVRYGFDMGVETTLSISPKLFTVSGERPEKAIRPDVISKYYHLGTDGYLKFVVGTEDRQWDELVSVIQQFRDAGVTWPVYIMPVGALDSQQAEIAEAVSNRALARGFNVSHRVHCMVYGNKLGT